MSKNGSSSTSSLSSSGSELPVIPEASEVVLSVNGTTKVKHCKPRDRLSKQKTYQEKGERFEPAFSRRPISTPVEQPSRFSNSNINSPPQAYYPSVCGSYEFVGAQNTITTYGPWPPYAAPGDVMMIPGSLPSVSWLCACDQCVHSVQEFIGALNNTNGMYAACVQSTGPVYNEVLQSGFHFPSPATGKLEPTNGAGGDATVTSTTGGDTSNVAKATDASSATTATGATAEAGSGAAAVMTNGIGASGITPVAPVAGVPVATNGVMIPQQNGYTLGAPIPLYPMPLIPPNGFMGNMMPAGNMMAYYNNNYWPVNMGMPGYPAGPPMMMGPYPAPPMMNGYTVETVNWTEANNNSTAETNKNYKKNDDVNNNEMIKGKNNKAAVELKEGVADIVTVGGESVGTAISKKEK